MDLQLEGKRALVTGSSRGIGAAIGGSDQAKVVIGELSDPKAAERCAEEALAAFGGVDILVNNAGLSGPSNWDTTQAENWVELYATNVAPAVRLSARFAPLMKARGWGRMIHIGSTAAALGLPSAVEYAATKAALANMSSSLAKHFGPFGITSNILGVGTVATLDRFDVQGKERESAGDPLYDALTGMAPHGHYNINPLQRTGRAEEIAYVVTMLASPLSSFVNGALIRVDGGKVPTIGL